MATEKRLIDANVVLAKQFTAGLSDASGNYYGHADVVFVNDIENAPIVDAVEVKHGYWKKHEETGYMGCSNCWDVFVDEEWLTEGRWNYCPNCGAKMDGERKDNGAE